MDFRPDMDAHLAAKKRQYTKKKKRARTILIAFLSITIAAIWILIGVVAYRLSQSTAPTPPAVITTDAATADFPDSTEPPVTVASQPSDTLTVSLSRSDISRGNLILVSFVRDLAYDFNAADAFIPLYGNKTSSYRIASTSLTLHPDTVAAFNEMFDAYKAETGNGDYQITQASRTLEEQTSIYDSYLDIYGVELGSQLAAAPGYSEHHSGYAVDMNVYTSDGISLSLGTAGDTDPIYSWIYDNAASYGFVLRYPDGKTDITGITNEPWHFRYVGKGHAEYMTENDLVLEEYIDLLYSYPHSGEHLTFTYGETEYEVFFVKFADGEETKEITLEKDTMYTVSGNNHNGVIVTVVK